MTESLTMEIGCGTEGHDIECLCDVKLDGPEPVVRYLPPALDGEGSAIEALLDWWQTAAPVIEVLGKLRQERDGVKVIAKSGVIAGMSTVDNAALYAYAIEATRQGKSLAQIKVGLALTFGRSVDSCTISRWRKREGIQGEPVARRKGAA